MRTTRLLMLSLGTVAILAAPVLQDAAQAQGRRSPRRAAPARGGGIVVAAYYRPLFLSPFYYDPFYDPWWYPYPYGWSPYGYGRQYYEDTASVRLQVTPRETEVYVDGYYAGTVDDFDGMFQRLRLEPGEHDVTLYLTGHRSEHQKIFLQDRGTFRIRHAMEPLAPGDAGEPRPAAAPRGPSTRRTGTPTPSPRGDEEGSPVRGDASFGAIAIRVQPGDAEVLIDGERWEGPQEDEALVVQVAPGAHRIEVRKEGYRSYSAEVAVTGAQTTPLNISLPRER